MSVEEFIFHDEYVYFIEEIWKQIVDWACLQDGWNRAKADKLYRFIIEIFLREDFGNLLFENETQELMNTLFSGSGKSKKRNY